MRSRIRAPPRRIHRAGPEPRDDGAEGVVVEGEAAELSAGGLAVGVVVLLPGAVTFGL
jgi:hypothetical protein